MNGSMSPSDPDRLSRRTFLGLLAGTGVALTATLGGGVNFLRGKWKRRTVLGGEGIQGTVLGANHKWGHRIRSGNLPVPSEVVPVEVLIAGGGIAGLSAGWKLLNSGFGEFRILELESSAGGDSRWGENAVSRYPWGAHYLPMPTRESRAVRELLQEMKVFESGPHGELRADSRHLCHAPHERLFVHGNWQGGIFPNASWGPEESRQVRRFEEHLKIWRTWKDVSGRSAFALPRIYSSSDPAVRKLDEISMATYLERHGLDSPRVRWYVDYACRDDYGCSIETTSAWAGLHYFCARGVSDPDVFTWPEGNGRIVQHLLDRIGDRVETGSLVYRIEPDKEGVTVDSIRVETGEVVRYRAENVVYSMPIFTAPYIVKGWDRSGLESFSYAPWMVANLTVDRVPEGAVWDNVLHRSPGLGYVVATHQNLQVHTGPSVLTYYRPFAEMDPGEARNRLLETSWSVWRDEILEDLSSAHPDLAGRVSRIDVMLHGHAMIRPTPGFMWGKVREEVGLPFQGIRFAHSDLSGFSLFEEAQYHGVRVAEEILESRGHDYESSL